MNNQPRNPEDSLTKRVLEQIEGERVAPRPRWEFVLENWFFWTLGGVAVALGAFAAAAALFEIANAGWAFYAKTHPDLLTFFIQAAPFLWLIALAVFIFVGYTNIRRTKRGYRYPFWIIACGAVLTSIVLGTALFAAGFGQEIDEAIGDHPPFYRPVVVEEHSWWENPSRGLLGGMVVAVSGANDSFTLQDFNGSSWTIDASELSTTSLAAVERGGQVRVIGVPDPDATSTLEACYVFAWQTYGAHNPAPPPAPFAVIPPPNETIAPATRSDECKGIRPYGPPRAAPGE